MAWANFGPVPPPPPPPDLLKRLPLLPASMCKTMTKGRSLEAAYQRGLRLQQPTAKPKNSWTHLSRPGFFPLRQPLRATARIDWTFYTTKPSDATDTAYRRNPRRKHEVEHRAHGKHANATKTSKFPSLAIANTSLQGHSSSARPANVTRCRGVCQFLADERPI